MTETKVNKVMAGGEAFALDRGEDGRSTLTHYLPSQDSWEVFNYDYVPCRQRHMDVICDTHYRSPVFFREDDHYLIVDLTSGESVRAPISSGEMKTKFVPHSRKLDVESVEEGLSEIGSFTNVFALSRGSLSLHDCWEKKQAVDFLEKERKKISDPREQKNIGEAIDQLRAAIDNDRVTFQASEALDKNVYCDADRCIPILTEQPHYRTVDVSTMLVAAAVPLPRNVEVSDAQWDYVSAPLQKDTGSPEAERQALRETTRRWENVLASKIGSGSDIGGWIGNFVGYFPLVSFVIGQTNCNNETNNNIGLVQGLQTAGLLRYHSVDPAKTFATLWGMHQAVLFQETESGEEYVLDSWPMGNGQLPLVQKEKYWNFLTTLPYNNLPSSESWQEDHPLHRAATDALGFLVFRQHVRAEFSNYRYNSLNTPTGALIAGSVLFFATDIALIPFSGKADGIPESTDRFLPGLYEQLLSYASAIYLGAEGSLAIQAGSTPAFYEMLAAGLPMAAGTMLSSGVAHEIGEAADIETLQYGEPGNSVAGFVGGIAAFLGLKKWVGEEVWRAVVQNVERVTVDRIGAGLLQAEIKVAAMVNRMTNLLPPVFNSHVLNAQKVEDKFQPEI